MQKTTKDYCCIFPFVYNNITYNECTTVNNKGVLWCSLDNIYKGNWGNCSGWCNGLQNKEECFQNQSYAVTIPENDPYVIKCADKSLIKIQNAVYGNAEGCPSKNVSDIIRKLCNKNNSCIIEPSNPFFGGDPCGGIRKYAIVDYMCFLEATSTSQTASMTSSMTALTSVAIKTESLAPSQSLLNSDLSFTTNALLMISLYSVAITASATTISSQVASISSSSQVYELSSSQDTASLSQVPTIMNLTFNEPTLLKPSPNSYLNTFAALASVGIYSVGIEVSAAINLIQLVSVLNLNIVSNKVSLLPTSPSLPYSDNASEIKALLTVGTYSVITEEWTTWSECSVTCGEGRKISYSLKVAKVPSKIIGSCNDMDCPVDGVWGSWIISDLSTKKCGADIVTYSRMCFRPSLVFNSLNCMGINNYTEVGQSNTICPVNGDWLEWSDWSLCNQPCGGDGLQSRFRYCLNPKYGGLPCDGNVTETRSCLHKSCQTVDLNLVINFLDVEYIEPYSNPTNTPSLKLKENIQNAVTKLYKDLKRKISIVIHSIGSVQP